MDIFFTYLTKNIHIKQFIIHNNELKNFRNQNYGSFCDQTDKPDSVVYSNLSRSFVTETLKPSLLYIRRADVKI